MPKAPKKIKREKDYPVSFRLTEKVRDLLREDAAEQQRTVTFVVHQILNQWYEWRRRQKKTEAMKKP